MVIILIRLYKDNKIQIFVSDFILSRQIYTVKGICELETPWLKNGCSLRLMLSRNGCVNYLMFKYETVSTAKFG